MLLSERVARLVVHHPRRLWLLLIVLLAVAGTLISFRAKLHSDVLDMLPSQFESVGIYKLTDREFSSARELIFGLVAENDETDLEAFAAHFTDRLRAEPWVVRAMNQSPLEAPGGLSELRAVALPLMLNQPPEDFAAFQAAITPEAIADRLHRMKAKIEAGGISAAKEEEILKADPLGIVFPALKGLRMSKGRDSGDPLFRVVFAHCDQPDLNEPACKETMLRVEDFKKRVLASWSGPAPRILCTGRTAYVAEMAAKLKSDIMSTMLGSIVLVGLTFWAGFRRWKPLRAIVDSLMLSCLLAIAMGAAFYGALNMITIGLCSILVGLGIDLAMVLYALYAHEREHGLTHEQAIAAALRTHGRGIWFGAMTTAAAFLCLLGSGSPGYAQLGVLIACGILIAALVMMTFLWLFLSISLPRWLYKTFCVLGWAALLAGAIFVAATMKTWSPYVWSNVLSGLGAAIIAVVLVRVLGKWTARVPALVLSRPLKLLVPGAALLLIVAVIAVAPVGQIIFDRDPKTLEPQDSNAGYALREIMKRLNPDKRDVVLAVIEAPDAEAFSAAWEKAQTAWEKLAPSTLTSVVTPAGLATSPARMTANAARLATFDFAKSRQAFLDALASCGFDAAQPEFAGAAGLLDALAEAATGSLNVVEWRRNLPEQSAWWFLIDSFISRERPLGMARLVPTVDIKEAHHADALRTALAVEGVHFKLSGWGFTLAELAPFSKSKMLHLSILMLLINIVILAVLLRNAREVLILMTGMMFSICGLFATMKLTGVSLNLFNVIAFPLVLGVGIDYSIYAALALRSTDPRHELAGLMKPLLLSGLTTVIGFITLAWAYNPALRGLGLLCGIGVGWCLITTFIFVLPAVALWMKPAAESGK